MSWNTNVIAKESNSSTTITISGGVSSNNIWVTPPYDCTSELSWTSLGISQEELDELLEIKERFELIQKFLPYELLYSYLVYRQKNVIEYLTFEEYLRNNLPSQVEEPIIDADWVDCTKRLPERGEQVYVCTVPHDQQDPKSCVQAAVYGGPGNGWATDNGWIGNEHPGDFESPGCVRYWKPIRLPKEYRS